MGCLLQRKGKTQEAATQFRAALAVDPNMTQANEWLAKLERPGATHAPTAVAARQRTAPRNERQLAGPARHARDPACAAVGPGFEHERRGPDPRRGPELLAGQRPSAAQFAAGQQRRKRRGEPSGQRLGRLRRGPSPPRPRLSSSTGPTAAA